MSKRRINMEEKIGRNEVEARVTSASGPQFLYL